MKLSLSWNVWWFFCKNCKFKFHHFKFHSVEFLWEMWNFFSWIVWITRFKCLATGWAFDILHRISHLTPMSHEDFCRQILEFISQIFDLFLPSVQFTLNRFGFSNYFRIYKMENFRITQNFPHNFPSYSYIHLFHNSHLCFPLWNETFF